MKGNNKKPAGGYATISTPPVISLVGRESGPRERLLKVPDVALWLGVSKDWVRAHASGRSEPRLPCVRVGRSIMRFKEVDLNDWAQRMGIAPC
jgi:hypothetical protein